MLLAQIIISILRLTIIHLTSMFNKIVKKYYADHIFVYITQTDTQKRSKLRWSVSLIIEVNNISMD